MKKERKSGGERKRAMYSVHLFDSADMKIPMPRFLKPLEPEYRLDVWIKMFPQTTSLYLKVP